VRHLVVALALASCRPPAGSVEPPPPEVEVAPPVIAAAAPAVVSAAPVVAAAAAPPWLKGSTHVHSSYSGDGDTPLGEVVAWYEARGYDFIVVTDHNRVTAEPTTGHLLVLPGVELTHNPSRCEPPPPEPDGKCRVHLNALILDVEPGPAGKRPAEIAWQERRSTRRLDQYQAAIERGLAMGGVLQVNHPRWHWGVDGALLAELAARGVALVEIGNAAFERWNAGEPGKHASSEAMWDDALTAGARVWGVASDDAHHFGARPGRGAYYPPGGGFVVVRAGRDAAAIREALARGEFYASSGVLLAEVAVRGDRYRVVVDERSPGEHRFTAIGSGGARLSEHSGRAVELALPAAGYLRVVVEDAAGRKAWTQPALPRSSDPAPSPRVAPQDDDGQRHRP
jgi:hypothetical protein